MFDMMSQLNCISFFFDGISLSKPSGRFRGSQHSHTTTQKWSKSGKFLLKGIGKIGMIRRYYKIPWIPIWNPHKKFKRILSFQELIQWCSKNFLIWLSQCAVLVQPTYDVRTTLLRCLFSVLTSSQRPYNIVLTSCTNKPFSKLSKNWKLEILQLLRFCFDKLISNVLANKS